MIGNYPVSYDYIEAEMGKIVKFFGEWVVTRDGIGCPKASYFISNNMLLVTFHDWQRHMSEKSWCNMADFQAAFDFAKEHQSKRAN